MKKPFAIRALCGEWSQPPNAVGVTLTSDFWQLVIHNNFNLAQMEFFEDLFC